MYSAVLMLALTAGSETADFGRNRCHGSTSGCNTAGATYGCSSGGHHRHGHSGNRGQGCSSSYGCSNSYGCSSSNGCSRSHGRHGGHGCASSYGCSSSQGGGLFSRHHRGHGCSSSYGCSSGYGCSSYGGGYGCTSGYGGTVIVPAKKEMPKGEPLPKPKQETQTAAPATIVVSLPADARLTVDGATTNSATERRTLVTPNLEVGSTYVYTMRAEIVRDGKTVAQVQEVTVRGGETSAVQFQFPQGVASR